MTEHAMEILSHRRFEFGQNWGRFLSVLDEARIEQAEKSLQRGLETTTLCNRAFLDIGSGSGLFSLAARRLGARVHSIDYDPKSVACTLQLKRRYFPGDDSWTIEEGSVLDEKYLRSLGKFDIVYSWGVLHHTGAMWQALGNAVLSLAPKGRLFISIYNDQGRASRSWKKIKELYNRLPRGLRIFVVAAVLARVWGPTTIRDFLQGTPFRSWGTYVEHRGMSPWWDVIDWVGGYPFEVAKPEEVFQFCRDRGLTLVSLKTCAGSLGCNEFVFEDRR